MGIDKITSQALHDRRTKPRVGQTVIYYIDGPSNERVSAAKVVNVIDRDTVEVELLHDSRRFTAKYAAPATLPANTPRPAGSWDFIV